MESADAQHVDGERTPPYVPSYPHPCLRIMHAAKFGGLSRGDISGAGDGGPEPAPRASSVKPGGVSSDSGGTNLASFGFVGD